MEKISLKIDNISFSYDKSFALKNINIDIPKEKFISIIGQNGSGKTTLFDIICGFKKPLNGNVIYNNKNIHKMNIKQRAKEFAIICQNEDVSFPFTCIEVVAMGMYTYISRFEKINDFQLNEIKNIMIMTDTYKFADKLITNLSGGEKQRVIIARALMQKTNIIFMDEAMSELDIHSKIKIIKVLKKLINERKITVIEIEHDLNNAFKFSDYVIALKNGELYKSGSPKEIMEEKFFEEVFEVKAEIVSDKGFFINNDIL